MKKILIVFGHHNINSSFNSEIRDTFIDEAKKCGHSIDLVNLFEESEQLPFYNSNFNPPPNLVLKSYPGQNACKPARLDQHCDN